MSHDRKKMEKTSLEMRNTAPLISSMKYRNIRLAI